MTKVLTYLIRKDVEYMLEVMSTITLMWENTSGHRWTEEGSHHQAFRDMYSQWRESRGL